MPAEHCDPVDLGRRHGPVVGLVRADAGQEPSDGVPGPQAAVAGALVIEPGDDVVGGDGEPRVQGAGELQQRAAAEQGELGGSDEPVEQFRSCRRGVQAVVADEQDRGPAGRSHRGEVGQIPDRLDALRPGVLDLVRDERDVMPLHEPDVLPLDVADLPVRGIARDRLLDMFGDLVETDGVRDLEVGPAPLGVLTCEPDGRAGLAGARRPVEDEQSLHVQGEGDEHRRELQRGRRDEVVLQEREPVGGCGVGRGGHVSLRFRSSGWSCRRGARAWAPRASP